MEKNELQSINKNESINLEINKNRKQIFKLIKIQFWGKKARDLD